MITKPDLNYKQEHIDNIINSYHVILLLGISSIQELNERKKNITRLTANEQQAYCLTHVAVPSVMRREMIITTQLEQNVFLVVFSSLNY